jgi:hypothetical protein
MQTKAERPKAPKFATEAEEAKWWDDHKEMVEENLIQAIRSGTARRFARGTRVSRNVTIRMAEADLDLARQQAEARGCRTKPTSSPCCTKNCSNEGGGGRARPAPGPTKTGRQPSSGAGGANTVLARCFLEIERVLPEKAARQLWTIGVVVGVAIISRCQPYLKLWYVRTRTDYWFGCYRWVWNLPFAWSIIRSCGW